MDTYEFMSGMTSFLREIGDVRALMVLMLKYLVLLLCVGGWGNRPNGTTLKSGNSMLTPDWLILVDEQKTLDLLLCARARLLVLRIYSLRFKRNILRVLNCHDLRECREPKGI